MIENLLSSYLSVIVLDSKALSKQILQKMRKDVPIIAADGAARWLQSDYIIGDIDSLSVSSSNGAQVICVSEQETTDFEKCMRFAEERNLLPSLVLGISGGEIDHVLGNIQALLKHAKNHSFFFLDDYQEGVKIGLPLTKGNYRAQVKPNATISILPFYLCTLTTKGLFWELENQALTPDGLNATRNRAIQDTVEFHIIEGKALVIIDI
ncbi:MAG: thiamine diphosphokinase [Simkaniaceae bacterium]|nr:MAG: thiamine diphosphokinase [Simkaniaceae bacterium]